MNPLLTTQEQAFSIATLAVRLGLVALATFVSVRITYLLIGRIEHAIRDEARGAEAAREKRAKTIGSVLRSVSRGLIILIGVLMAVHELGLDITPALAAAGGFGVAAGLGAQSLIKDWIAGFFFIQDNQFAVGDVILISLPTEEPGGIFGGPPRVKRLRVGSIFRSGLYEYDSSFGIVLLETAQSFFVLNRGVTGFRSWGDELYEKDREKNSAHDGILPWLMANG